MLQIKGNDVEKSGSAGASVEKELAQKTECKDAPSQVPMAILSMLSDCRCHSPFRGSCALACSRSTANRRCSSAYHCKVISGACTTLTPRLGISALGFVCSAMLS